MPGPAAAVVAGLDRGLRVRRSALPNAPGFAGNPVVTAVCVGLEPVTASANALSGFRRTVDPKHCYKQAQISFTCQGRRDSLERDPYLVNDDVKNGFASLEAALRDYGVVIDLLNNDDR